MGKWISISDAPRQTPLLFRSYERRGEAAVGVVNALGEICTLWGQDGIGFEPTHCMLVPELPEPIAASNAVN